ncbi:MAG: Ig-like domain-containing protein, partial [Pseudomonadota bacterium]
APIAGDDTASTPENTATVLSVLANDLDPDGSLVPGTVTVVSQPTGGAAVENANGTITYTPNQGFVGTDTLTYTVQDNDGATSNTATVTLTVGSPNQAPVSVADSATTGVDVPVEIPVLANDSDADGTLDVSSVLVTTQPTNGSVQVNPTGTVTYTPNQGFNGTDSFAYTVADDDGAVSQPATASVTVGSQPLYNLVTTGGNGVNVPNFTLSGEFTIEGWIYFTPGEVIDNKDGFLQNNADNIHINFWEGQMRLASYVPGQPQGDVVTANTAVGTGEWNHFALTRDASGITRIYTNGVLDGTATEAFTANLTVDEIASTLRGTTDGAFDEMRFWNVERSASEIASTMSSPISPSSPGLVRYYSFDDPAQVVDDTGGSASVTPPAGVSLEVSTSPVSVGNAAPVAVNDAAATDENAAVVLSVLGNDSDFDGTLVASTVTVVSGPTSGNAVENPDGTITYTPNNGFVGNDSFTYTVEDDDSAVSNTATVSLSVGAPNQAPVAADDNAVTAIDVPIEISVLSNDSDIDGTLDPATVTVTTQPTNGSVQINPSGTVTYTPSNGFQGVDSFVYTVDDNDAATSNSATATVVVGNANQRALTSDGSSNIDVSNLRLNGAFTIESWVYFDPGSSIGSSDALITDTSGKVALNFADGLFRFSSTKNGAPQGDLAVATTAITPGSWSHVAATRDAGGTLRIYVDGVLEATSTEQWTSALVIDELLRGTTGNSDMTVDEFRIWSGTLTNGEIVALSGQEIDPNTPGLERYYRFNSETQVVDETGNSNSLALPAGMTVAASTAPIGPEGNLPPAVENDNLVADADVATNLAVLANDFDIDGTIDPATVTILSQPSFGTATPLANGTVDYQPNPGYEGNDSFTYTVADTQGAVSAAATVSLAVGDAPFNRPVANDDAFALIEDAVMVPLAVFVNDTDPTDDPLSISSITVQPTNGSITLVNGQPFYTPNAGYDGTDSFSYIATDGTYDSEFAAQVDLTIASNFEQPQTLVDPKIAPEIDASGDFLILERVAKMPLSSTGTQPNMNSFAYTDDDRIFVGTEGDVDNQSRIWELVDDGNGGQTFELFMDIGPLIPANTGRELNNDNPRHGGMRSVEFHPDFNDPTKDGYGKFYTAIMEGRPANTTGHTYLSDADTPIAADSVLVEWTYDHTTGEVDTMSYREVFRVGMPVFDHTIRQISFNPHAVEGDEDYGLLYVGHGDGSVQSATAGGGQNNDALGKIIRVDPLEDTVNGTPYSVPATNPFVGDPNMIDEVYAIGFRNPAHLSFADDGNGGSVLVVTSIGRDNFDEVNIVEPGENYGWAFREGPLVHLPEGGGIVNGVAPLPADDADNGFTYPATFIGHEGDPGVGFVGRALTGGYTIQNGTTDLNDQFIFGEFATTGRVFSADINQLDAANDKLAPGEDPSDLTWVTPEEVTILFDHDNDDTTTPIVKDSIKDILDDNPDFEVGFAAGKTRADIRFGQGPDGELYVLNKRDGWLYLAENTVPDDLIV